MKRSWKELTDAEGTRHEEGIHFPDKTWILTLIRSREKRNVKLITHRDKISLVKAYIQNSIESPTSRSVWPRRMHSERPSMRVILVCILDRVERFVKKTGMLPDSDSENQAILSANGSIVQPPQPVGPADIHGGGRPSKPYTTKLQRKSDWSEGR